MLIFGQGNLYGVSDAANSTPRRFGELQDIAFDFSFTTKSLHGQRQFAIDIKRGTGKLTGKAKLANINGSLLNELFFGESATTGQLLSAIDEAGTVTTAAITVANAANFSQDLGVRYASTGVALTRVASTPAQGEYSEASGVYTFNTADNTTAMLIDYTYTSASGGKRIALGGKTIGQTPKFSGIFTATVDGKTITLKLNACTSNKLAMATKLEDYTIPEFDFEAMLDTAGSIGEISVPD